MHPTQRFKANFEHNEVTDKTSDNPTTGCTVGHTELHDTDSHVRNLCLVWEDGRRAFFNYAYLVSVDLILTDNLNEMLLYFSGQVVTLKGYQLRALFDLLLDHLPKTITARNPRYQVNEQTMVALVTAIHIKSE